MISISAFSIMINVELKCCMKFQALRKIFVKALGLS